MNIDVDSKVLMEIKYTINSLDTYRAFVNIYRSPMHYILTSVWAVIVYYIGFDSFELISFIIMFPIIFVMLSVATRVSTPLLMLLNPYWRKGRIGEHTITIDENYFIESTESNRTSIGWSHIERVYVRANSISIQYNQEICYIPQRDFSTQQWSDLRELLKQKVDEKRYKVLKMSLLKYLLIILSIPFIIVLLSSMHIWIDVWNSEEPKDIKTELIEFDKRYQELSKISYIYAVDMSNHRKLIKLFETKMLIYSKSQNSILKTNLIYKMGDTHDSNLVGLIKIYLKDRDSIVVESAIKSLGKLGDRDTLELLYPYQKSENPNIRDMAQKAIDDIKKRVMK